MADRAAVEALSQGASVLLLEPADSLGGSTTMPAGVEDFIERMYKHYQALDR